MNWVVIADEVSALGWRLAGARTLIATDQSVAERFAEARHDADLILITAALARRLPDPVLEVALLAQKPLLAVIAGETDGSEPPDVEKEVQRVLGIAV